MRGKAWGCFATFVHSLVYQTIAAWKGGGWLFSDLCKEFGINRKTGYKYLERYESEGIDGLKDRSKNPKKHPNETPENVVILIIRKKTPESLFPFSDVKSPNEV
ncbi:DNA-binding helix-turn-helix protein [Leptospira interrogans str. L1207]|nr:DNA-binding helix-turn-helix protein [Leptospira interrogans str. L1207]